MSDPRRVLLGDLRARDVLAWFMGSPAAAVAGYSDVIPPAQHVWFGLIEERIASPDYSLAAMVADVRQLVANCVKFGAVGASAYAPLFSALAETRLRLHGVSLLDPRVRKACLRLLRDVQKLAWLKHGPSIWEAAPGGQFSGLSLEQIEAELEDVEHGQYTATAADFHHDVRNVLHWDLTRTFLAEDVRFDVVHQAGEKPLIGLFAALADELTDTRLPNSQSQARPASAPSPGRNRRAAAVAATAGFAEIAPTSALAAAPVPAPAPATTPALKVKLIVSSSGQKRPRDGEKKKKKKKKKKEKKATSLPLLSPSPPQQLPQPRAASQPLPQSQPLALPPQPKSDPVVPMPETVACQAFLVSIGADSSRVLQKRDANRVSDASFAAVPFTRRVQGIIALRQTVRTQGAFPLDVFPVQHKAHNGYGPPVAKPSVIVAGSHEPVSLRIAAPSRLKPQLVAPALFDDDDEEEDVEMVDTADELQVVSPPATLPVDGSPLLAPTPITVHVPMPELGEDRLVDPLGMLEKFGFQPLVGTSGVCIRWEVSRLELGVSVEQFSILLCTADVTCLSAVELCVHVLPTAQARIDRFASLFEHARAIEDAQRNAVRAMTNPVSGGALSNKLHVFTKLQESASALHAHPTGFLMATRTDTGQRARRPCAIVTLVAPAGMLSLGHLISSG